MLFIELFAGAGGMSLGLEAAGMQHLLSFERDEAPHSVLVHAGKLAIRMDLKDVGNACLAMRQQPNLIAGGPPCQDFSTAGKRQITDRARLTRHFAQIVCLQRVQWFIFENVPRAADSKEYAYARGLWKRHGYGLTETVLDAQFYGVPQRRERFFCIGRLGEIDGFLLAELKAAATSGMVVRDILDPERHDDAALLSAGAFFVRPWMGKSGEPNGRGVLSIDEPCPTITRNRHEAPGKAYQRHPDDAADINDAHILTPDQVARIQGFPTTYDFKRKAKKRAAEGWPEKVVNLMVANAVPVTMAQRIGKVIFDRHHGLVMPKLDKHFTDFLLSRTRKNPKAAVLSDRVIENLRHNVNRALYMCDGRIYADVWRQIAHLEEGSDKSGKHFSTLKASVQSDLRNAITAYHEYRTDEKRFPPSEWAPPKIKPGSLLGLFRKPSKPKRKRKTTPAHAIDPAPPRTTASTDVRWPKRRANAWQEDPEAVTDLFDRDHNMDYDGYTPVFPTGDPSEYWRPEGYHQDDYDGYYEADGDDESE
jgi:DNA (cytosine-5)-methyltransferase 1